MFKNQLSQLLKTRQGGMFLSMLALSVFVLILTAYRLTVNHIDEHIPTSLQDLTIARGANDIFIYLGWNLFLAWLPFGAALLFSRQTTQLSNTGKLKLGLSFALWLAFFPNAPYIVTDLVHLRFHTQVPYWLDIIILFSGGLNGLLLGVFSLFEIKMALNQILHSRYLKFFVPLMLLAGGFGVWLGRFQRWNSWDLFTQPHRLLYDLFQLIFRTDDLIFALKITFLVAALMSLMYFMLWVLISQRTLEK